jgi:hypothetical protein
MGSVEYSASKQLVIPEASQMTVLPAVFRTSFAAHLEQFSGEDHSVHVAFVVG